MSGWILLYSHFTEWEWFDKPEMVKLFLYLLLNANDENTTYRGIKIKRGQLLRGLSKLSSDLNMTTQTVRTCLNRLEKTGEIKKETVKKTTDQGSIITLCNYESYKNALTDLQQTSNRPPTDLQQTSNRPTAQVTDLQQTYDAKTNRPLNGTKRAKKQELNIGVESSNQQTSNRPTHTPLTDLFDEKEEQENEKENIPLCNPYIKEKEKEKEEPLARGGDIIENNIATAKNARTKKPKKDKNEFLHPCRLVFENHFSTIFESMYYWTAKDAAAMVNIIKKITFSRSERGLPVEQDDIVNALKCLLESIQDNWILKNFSVTNINSKYNEIVSQAKLNRNGTNRTCSQDVCGRKQEANIAVTRKASADIERLLNGES